MIIILLLMLIFFVAWKTGEWEVFFFIVLLAFVIGTLMACAA